MGHISERRGPMVFLYSCAIRFGMLSRVFRAIRFIVNRRTTNSRHVRGGLCRSVGALGIDCTQERMTRQEPTRKR